MVSTREWILLITRLVSVSPLLVVRRSGQQSRGAGRCRTEGAVLETGAEETRRF